MSADRSISARYGYYVDGHTLPTAPSPTTTHLIVCISIQIVYKGQDGLGKMEMVVSTEGWKLNFK